ncbi:expressed unknown protein [Ectocarpus siliculosus]|uniref:Uncharacterized protein n=1 Tax=Ectocarpus siliculosus TaxID=2880 RepID=D7FMQ5_ECTSI|nr:expressed unknown protein [Ectocarpus siliculosus]|eukprot:CBJ25952.1 expressed unknown protein [Ectocarpus siliculosus]
MALLEGTLLTNGDIKGSWRARREDEVSQDFLMVLMDKGVYDGGFNLQLPNTRPSAPSVQEVHDKWHSFEWVETTKSSCNVWGRGLNNQFGEFYTIGVHDPRQRRIVIYKVCEAEMRRAQAFAQMTITSAGRLPAAAPSDPGLAAPKRTRSATAKAAAVAATAGGRQKRPRAYDASPREMAAAATLLYQQNLTVETGACSGGSSSSSSSGGGCYPRVDAFCPSYDGDAGGGGGGSGSGGGPALGGGRPLAFPAPQVHKENPARPTPVPIPAEVRALPGFSGRFEDASTVDFANASMDELADLSILGARLQREKVKIQEDARAQRQPFEEQKKEYQSKVQKGRADEAMMLRAVQELRKQMLEDERKLESATQCVKSYEAEEQHALMLWNEKWETQVAPFIAQCEQGVKKKAEELEIRTREAEREKLELEREKERLHSVKQIGDVFPANQSM